MARRAEEKERRRQERIAREEAARRAAARKRTLRLGGGIAVGLVIIAAVALLALGGKGGDNKGVSVEKLTADAKAAGCTFKSYPSEGRTHTANKVNYKTNPPTSGNHNPTPASDGIYRAGNTPPKENFVHSLEHGRIEFQYKPGTPKNDVAKLQALASEPLNGSAGYHVLLFENNTNMPTQFAATAWTKAITCGSVSPAAISAMREFRETYTDKGPEFIP